jgi:hypothetical protein
MADSKLHELRNDPLVSACVGERMLEFRDSDLDVEGTKRRFVNDPYVIQFLEDSSLEAYVPLGIPSEPFRLIYRCSL